MVMLPLVNGNSQALWQSKVAAEAQGRVFAVRRMVSMIISPVATVLAGPLAERVFTPALMPGGALAGTVIGQMIGVGPGRGMGLLIVLTGLIVALVMLIPILHPRIRNVETELPDAVSQEPTPVMDAPDALPVTTPDALTA
jgi:MFS transporter, DHA3 family, macrolide efflux protein